MSDAKAKKTKKESEQRVEKLAEVPVGKATPDSTAKPLAKVITPEQRPKVGFLALLIIGSSAVFWYCLEMTLTLNGGPALRLSLLPWFIATFLAFFIMIALIATLALLVHERLIARCILLLAALTHLAWFRLGWYTFIAVMLLILSFWYYDWKIKEEESLRIKFSVSKSIRYGLHLTITAVLLAVSLTFYAMTEREQPTAQSILKPFSSILGVVVADYLQNEGLDPNETVDSFLLRMVPPETEDGQGSQNPEQPSPGPLDLSGAMNVIGQINPAEIDGILQQLPPDVREEVRAHPEAFSRITKERGYEGVETRFNESRDRLIASVGFTASGDTPMSEVIPQIVGRQLEQFLGQYVFLIPPIIALSLFFALSIFGFFYAFCITIIAQLIFWIVKATKFVKIHEVETRVQVASLGDT